MSHCGYFTGNYRGQQLNIEPATTTQQNIILMSTNANIISKMTAFVAVDKNADSKVIGEKVKRSCPVPVATQDSLLLDDLDEVFIHYYAQS